MHLVSVRWPRSFYADLFFPSGSGRFDASRAPVVWEVRNRACGHSVTGAGDELPRNPSHQLGQRHAVSDLVNGIMTMIRLVSNAAATSTGKPRFDGGRDVSGCERQDQEQRPEIVLKRPRARSWQEGVAPKRPIPAAMEQRR
jgi:hypothetical protein